MKKEKESPRVTVQHLHFARHNKLPIVLRYLAVAAAVAAAAAAAVAAVAAAAAAAVVAAVVVAVWSGQPRNNLGSCTTACLQDTSRVMGTLQRAVLMLQQQQQMMLMLTGPKWLLAAAAAAAAAAAGDLSVALHRHLLALLDPPFVGRRMVPVHAVHRTHIADCQPRIGRSLLHHHTPFVEARCGSFAA